MKETQQQSTNAPVVCCGCSCSRRSKNRVSATQMPTQEGDRRGEFNSDAALTQPVQGAQAARVQSINPWVPKLTQKPTKVTFTNKVRNKEVELTSYVFNVVYRKSWSCQPCWRSYKPYISDGNQEEDKEPEFFRTDERQLVLKKVAAFYTKVPMPCVVPNAKKSILTVKKPTQKCISGIKHIILLKLMQESGDYKVATALVGVNPKVEPQFPKDRLNPPGQSRTRQSVKSQAQIVELLRDLPAYYGGFPE
ncbi:hypothetical protein DSO57_1000601 [Entomophthora muscae]|uniref:Uncharacterized protein n=1 Tax=Entomophthora muscae TaxID=34485 RepID=A0ACC2S066_9FUNG|nr:hypothetical protein DSO57_1000601 [Entomophthora muscae]